MFTSEMKTNALAKAIYISLADMKCLLGYIGIDLKSSGTGFCKTVNMVEVGRFILWSVLKYIAQG